MFVEGFAVISADGGVIEDCGFVFHAGCCGGEEIVAVEGAHESVDGSFSGEMRENFVVSALEIESQVRTFTAFLLHI